MEPAREERILFQAHPSLRSMLGFHARGFAVSVAAGALAGGLSALAAGRVRPGWVLAAVLAVFAVVITRSALRLHRVTYTITNHRLTIEVGLLGRAVHETRLEQIQNVNSSQSLLERALGVGSVFFDTAGGAAFEFAFRGVADPRHIVRMVNEALRHHAVA